MLQHYREEDLPPMDFWDMTCVTVGKFYKAHCNIPENVYVPIKVLEVPTTPRVVGSLSALRAGYKARPNCVFVAYKRGSVRILSGWLK